MEINPIQMNDEYDNKENTVLRNLEGDPNRHTSVVDQRPPSTIFAQQQRPSMYTLETRYQPIPAKVSPTKNEPRVYYIGAQRDEEPAIINENRQTPIPIQSEQPATVPTVFLEPKIISQPIFYSIADTKPPSMMDNSPIPINKEKPSPTVYSITGRQRRPTIDMSADNLEIPPSTIEKTPRLYSLAATPRFEKQNQEPEQQFLQPPANLYSIIGSPARTSRGVQVSPEESIRPRPILYTVVGDTPNHTDRSTEKRALTYKKQSTETTMYTLDNEANALKAQQQQKSPPIQKPSLYSIVGKPTTPPYENRAKPPVRKKTPPLTTTTTTTTTNRRVSRSPERKTEARNQETISYPIIKAKEQKPAKAETMYIPLDERRQAPPPIQTSPEQTQRKPYTTTQYQPIQLPDYHSPYANRTTKPFRERKYNNNALPVIHSERKPRPPLYEPRYRVERRQPYTPIKPTSLERFPVNTEQRSNLWDNDYQTQSDDDEEYEQRMNKKKRSYKTSRPRAPWIPVW